MVPWKRCKYSILKNNKQSNRFGNPPGVGFTILYFKNSILNYDRNAPILDSNLQCGMPFGGNFDNCITSSQGRLH